MKREILDLAVQSLSDVCLPDGAYGVIGRLYQGAKGRDMAEVTVSGNGTRHVPVTSLTTTRALETLYRAKLAKRGPRICGYQMIAALPCEAVTGHGYLVVVFLGGAHSEYVSARVGSLGDAEWHSGHYFRGDWAKVRAIHDAYVRAGFTER